MKSYFIEIFFILAALMIVIALAWLILRSFKTFYSHKNRDNPLSIKLALPIGSREKIMVIEYQNTEYLLGVTPTTINLLDKTVLDLEKNSLPKENQ